VYIKHREVELLGSLRTREGGDRTGKASGFPGRGKVVSLPWVLETCQQITQMPESN
jgi:hypothetical protein